MSASAEIVVIFICLFGQAFFAGIETGVISISRMRLRHFVRQGDPGARTLQVYLEHFDRLLGTTLVGTNLSVVILSVISASIAARYLGHWGEPVSAVIVALVVLVFCEYLPKAWFHSRPIERCRRFAGLLRITEILFKPFSMTIIALSRLLVRGGEDSLSSPAPFVTREDLKVLAQEGEKDGVLSPRERFMIHRVMELSHKTAGQIMVPAARMTTVTSETSVEAFRTIARTSAFTRMPVYDSDEDRYMGVVNIFSILSGRKVAMDRKVGSFARASLYVDEDMPADDILPLMRRARQPLCLVRNSAKTVVGLLTTEDVLKEIVGKL
ncbi:MAG: CNNM domain-containing protein [Kiritimatiellia bacterium]|jgi:CBS domain containing-hemolysin-like protein|nr:CNNM domain-containing protein [Kiritimatiellia bacterium]MDP6631814.1 CNNM domain-containing protein [Kiritimatiellia bacterium]MDP6811484.1 CNNM domain-containing protein [Kiritimatiellia bacterium]MDP7023426.1 CNNM domain-containing protein [Kiritimatiellia bacterium]